MKKKKFTQIKDKVSWHTRIRGIQVKLIGAYLIPILLILLLGAFSYFKASSAIISNYQAAMRDTIQKTSEYYALMLQEIDTISQKYSSNAEIRKYYDGFYQSSPADEKKVYGDLNAQIHAENNANAQINNIIVLAPYGQGLTTTGMIFPDVYKEFVETEEGKKILNSQIGQSFWAGYHKYIDKALVLSDGSYGISLGRAIFNNQLKPIGALFIDVDMKAMQTPLQTIDLPEGSYFALITPDGREITANGENTKALFYGQDFYEQVFASSDPNGLTYLDYQGETYLFIYSKVGESGCMLSILIPQNVILKQADGIKVVTIFVVMFAIIVAILIGVGLAAGIGKAIRDINTVVKKAEEGDLTVVAQTKRKDEFKLLTKHITGMLTGMRTLVNRTADVSYAVSESAETVASASGQLVEVSKNITDVLEHMEAGIEQQAEDAKNCLKKMEALDEKISIVNKSTGQITQFANDTKTIVKTGITTMNELGKKAKETSNITKTVIENIEELETESASIGGITATINEIADRTNLLALNASIEAARGGEAGKGFAVVAEEIRKLAEASREASNKIQAIIEQIQHRTKETVVTAKEAEEIVNSQELALLDTSKAFHNITEHVEGLTKNISEISLRVKDIEATKNETLNAISSICAVLQETAAASSEVRSAADNQLSAAEDLNNAAGNLREKSEELQGAISSFKL